jgi:hypothetical protein
MNNQLIAYCGLDCAQCPAYIATQANDQAALEKVAADWREQFNSPDITVEAVICDGCLGTNGGRLGGYCSMCEVRACATEKAVTNCAHCADYACEKLENFFGMAPQARTTLDEIRRSL